MRCFRRGGGRCGPCVVSPVPVCSAVRGNRASRENALWMGIGCNTLIGKEKGALFTRLSTENGDKTMQYGRRETGAGVPGFLCEICREKGLKTDGTVATMKLRGLDGQLREAGKTDRKPHTRLRQSRVFFCAKRVA